MEDELNLEIERLNDCIKINKLVDNRGYVLGNKHGQKEKLVRTIFNTRDNLQAIVNRKNEEQTAKK